MYGHECVDGCKCWFREEDNPTYVRESDDQSTWLTPEFFDQFIASKWQLKWWTNRAWLYWVGLTDNQYFKMKYISFRGRVNKRLKWVDRLTHNADENWKRKRHPNYIPELGKRKKDQVGIAEEWTDTPKTTAKEPPLFDGEARWNDKKVSVSFGRYLTNALASGPLLNQELPEEPFLIGEDDWNGYTPYQKWIIQVVRIQTFYLKKGWEDIEAFPTGTHRNHHVPEELIGHLKEMEELLGDQFELLYLASTGVQHLIPRMFELRVEIQTRQITNVAAADDLVAWTNTFNILADNWRNSIENNDQLPFKAFLFLINLMTFLGQSVYFQYISPERIYKCTST